MSEGARSRTKSRTTRNAIAAPAAAERARSASDREMKSEASRTIDQLEVPPVRGAQPVQLGAHAARERDRARPGRLRTCRPTPSRPSTRNSEARSAGPRSTLATSRTGKCPRCPCRAQLAESRQVPDRSLGPHEQLGLSLGDRAGREIDVPVASASAMSESVTPRAAALSWSTRTRTSSRVPPTRLTMRLRSPAAGGS